MMDTLKAGNIDEVLHWLADGPAMSEEANLIVALAQERVALLAVARAARQDLDFIYGANRTEMTDEEKAARRIEILEGMELALSCLPLELNLLVNGIRYIGE